MIPEEPQFTDWQIKRVRHRLLVYLMHLQYPYDSRDKTLPPAQTSKKGEAGRVANTRPSWNTVAVHIQYSPEAEPWVWFEGPKSGSYKRIMRDEHWVAPKRGEKSKNKPKIQTTKVYDNRLYKFVDGEPINKNSNFPIRKYETPNGYSIKGITEYLKAKGFLSKRDFIEPAGGQLREGALAFFSSLGLSPQEIRETEYFYGDYIATKCAPSDNAEQCLLEVHTDTERRYNRSTREQRVPKLYKARITLLAYPNGDDLYPEDTILEGFGTLSPSEHTLFHFTHSFGGQVLSYVGVVGMIELGETVIAGEGVKKKKGEKIRSLVNHAQRFTHVLRRLPTDNIATTVKLATQSGELDDDYESEKDYAFKYLFEKSLDRNLLFNNINGIMVEDSNKTKGADKKQKNLSGKFLLRNTQKEAEELGVRLLEEDLETKDLIQKPDPRLTYQGDVPLEFWPEYKDKGFNERLAFAAQFHDLPIALEAIEHGADVNYTDPVLTLPVILVAARCGSSSVVRVLLEQESLNLLVKDQDGNSLSEIMMNKSYISQSTIKSVIEMEIKQANAVGKVIENVAAQEPLLPNEP